MVDCVETLQQDAPRSDPKMDYVANANQDIFYQVLGVLKPNIKMNVVIL